MCSTDSSRVIIGVRVRGQVAIVLANQHRTASANGVRMRGISLLFSVRPAYAFSS